MGGRLTMTGDVVVGAAAVATTVVLAVARAAGRVVAPVVPLVAHPPLVPERFSPGHVVEVLATRGQTTRASLTGQAQRLADDLVPAVTDEVLDRIDLTDVALSRLDIERIVKAALAEMDLTAIVRDQVDLVGIAEYVIDEIDLPEIIRQSSGMVASEAVRGVRMQSMEADEAVSRIVDRLLLRRRQRRTDAPGEPTPKDELT